MSVHLSVVGIFYSYEIDTSPLPPAYFSVKDIMDLAVRQTVDDRKGVKANLRYSYATAHGAGPGPAEYVDFISAKYTADPKVQPPPKGVTSISGKTYPFGTYALTQTATTATNIDSASYTVWQYYVFDKDNKVVKAGQRAEVPFNQTKVVQNGFSIVWRLVTISSRPIVANPRVASLLDAPTIANVT